MWFSIIASVIGVTTLLLLHKLYHCMKGAPGFWGKYGILQIDTSPALSLADILLGRKLLITGDDYVYHLLAHRGEAAGGVVEFGKPLLVLHDVELIKKVMIKDFDHFTDRRDFFSAQASIIKRMLVELEGDEWKRVRAALSPAFTTGRIRGMMGILNSLGREWVEKLATDANNSSEENVPSLITVDVLKTVTQYTMDVIGSAVFGVAPGAIQNLDSVFCQMATRLNGFTTWQLVKGGILLLIPKLGRLLRLSVFDKSALDYLERIFDAGLKARLEEEERPSGSTRRRNDIMQLLLEAKRGKLIKSGIGDEDELMSLFDAKGAELKGVKNHQARKSYYHLPAEMISAQSLVFFFAGFSSVTKLIAFVAYTLAAHPTVQDRLRREVEGIATQDDGSLDYDALNQLVYLDMVICEVNRLYPVTGRLERKCVKQYEDPESGIIVPKGAIVAIPVHALHTDPKYYSHPTQFHPEHFSPAAKAERSPYVYLPFGIGPRNCIGMRFAMTEVKAAVAHLVLNFLITPSQKTPLPVRGDPEGWQLVPPKNLELKLTPIKHE